ncbi:MAG TPA: hypothetical protein VIF15_12300 [Polyangiaceae bacterium]
MLALVLGVVFAGGGCANGGDSSATGGDDSGSTGDDVTVPEAGDGASTCAAPKTACGSTCTSLTNDPKNCGKCGVACGANQVCNLGQCETSCSPPQTMCGGPTDAGGAVDASKEAGGDSGAKDSGTVADAATGDGGVVQPYCANTGTDSSNCGACGHVCPPNHTCNNGLCGLSCPPGQRACIAGDTCIPSATCCSSADCPVTGEICPQPGGACQCPSGEKICNKTNSCIGGNNCCTTTDCTVSGSTCPTPGQACICANGQKACAATNSCIPLTSCCTGDDCGPEPGVATYSCVSGTCGILSCNAGCFNLDGVYTNGCECCDDALGKSCGAPTGLGVLALGQTVNQQGVAPAAGESDWLQVTFASESNKAFHAHITFTSNPGSQFAFDLSSSCGTPLGCTEGGSCTGKTDWEVYYAAGDPTGSTWAPIGAIGTIYIRVYRVTGSPTCDQWALSVSE